jgi:hypothetical protein
MRSYCCREDLYSEWNLYALLGSHCNSFLGGEERGLGYDGIISGKGMSSFSRGWGGGGLLSGFFDHSFAHCIYIICNYVFSKK